MSFYSRSWVPVFAIVVLLLGVAPSGAKADTEYELTLYVWATSLNGQTSLGPLPFEVDAGFSDLLENVDVAGMVAVRGKKGRWAWMLDTQYVELANDETPNLVVEADQLIAELDAAYEVREGIEILFGARYVDLESRVTLSPTLPVPGGGSQSFEVMGGRSVDWTDPVVGLRFALPLGKRWAFVGRGDVGGFGIGSDFAWNLVATASYQATQKISVAFGYRVLNMDYEEGSGAERFLYDVELKGPGTAVTVRF